VCPLHFRELQPQHFEWYPIRTAAYLLVFRTSSRSKQYDSASLVYSVFPNMDESLDLGMG
jgi:hypothetical protein